MAWGTGGPRSRGAEGRQGRQHPNVFSVRAHQANERTWHFLESRQSECVFSAQTQFAARSVRSRGEKLDGGLPRM